MPRGKYTNHKGRTRRFTSAEELEEQRKKDEYRQKKAERGMESSDEEEEEEEEEGSGEESGSGSEDNEDENAHHKAKGVESLIEISNPNRAAAKALKVAPSVPPKSSQPELSRREREEIEKQRASAHYHMLHVQGKTAQARADLARLAIIKQQREDAAKRREAEKAEREAVKQNKAALTQKALGKKT